MHRYMLSSAGCWASYTAILAREYSDPEYFEVHQFTVDAYAVQHPGGKDAQSLQSVTTHLIRLCLQLEHGVTGKPANGMMMRAREACAPFIWLDPPACTGQITASDLIDVGSADEHQQRVRAWAHSAWEAWAPHHGRVRQWIDAAN